MDPSHPPELKQSPKAKPLSELYQFIPRMAPSGWKLRLTSTNDDVLYHVSRRPTTPPRYRIHPVKNHETKPLTIRVKVVNGNVRFTLYEDQTQIFSIRPAATTRQFLLQDAQRRILAKFVPITPNTILMRSDTGTVARIRAKEQPSPMGWKVECKISDPQTWLLGVLLYVVIRIEDFNSASRPESSDQEFESEPAPVDSP
jgi:hypothetical protein